MRDNLDYWFNFDQIQIDIIKIINGLNLFCTHTHTTAPQTTHPHSQTTTHMYTHTFSEKYFEQSLPMNTAPQKCYVLLPLLLLLFPTLWLLPYNPYPVRWVGHLSVVAHFKVFVAARLPGAYARWFVVLLLVVSEVRNTWTAEEWLTKLNHVHAFAWKSRKQDFFFFLFANMASTSQSCRIINVSMVTLQWILDTPSQPQKVTSGGKQNVLLPQVQFWFIVYETIYCLCLEKFVKN